MQLAMRLGAMWLASHVGGGLGTGDITDYKIIDS